MTDFSQKTPPAKADQARQRGCGNCQVINCDTRAGSFPEICPTRETADDPNLTQTLEIYKSDQLDARLAKVAASVEADYYCQLTRLEETIVFARRLGYTRIGIASCAGLLKESRTILKIFEAHDLAVKIVCCKVGAVDKLEIGLSDEMKVCPGQNESICNPIMQARYLNAWPSELNVIVGLCVGHDALFIRHAQAPTTLLAAKDRVLGHNPLACVYTSSSYYSRLLDPKTGRLREYTE